MQARGKVVSTRLLSSLLLFGMAAQAVAVESKSPATNPPKIGEPGDNPPSGGFGSRPRPTPGGPASSSITFKTVNSNTVALTFKDVDIEAGKAEERMRASVDNLVAEYEKNRLAEQKVYDDINNSAYAPHNSVIVDLADDERMLSDMKCERMFYDQILWLTNTLGVSALGAAASYAAKIFSDAGGVPVARMGLALSALTAAVSKGSVFLIEEKKRELDTQIEWLQEAIDRRGDYLMWQIDYGGDGAPKPFQGPTCIYKTSCVEALVCVSEGLFGKENCKKKETCATELLTCHSDD